MNLFTSRPLGCEIQSIVGTVTPIRYNSIYLNHFFCENGMFPPYKILLFNPKRLLISKGKIASDITFQGVFLCVLKVKPTAGIGFLPSGT